jgi:hypothetical protein
LKLISKTKEIAMKNENRGMVHALEFNCQAPLRFYEQCASCPKFGDECPELALGIELLRGKKKLVYNRGVQSEDAVHLSEFNCMAPLFYFEKTRSNCPHQGRCREEGLLLALLYGKRQLSYAQKTAIELPPRDRRREQAGAEEAVEEKAVRS